MEGLVGVLLEAIVIHAKGKEYRTHGTALSVMLDMMVLSLLSVVIPNALATSQGAENEQNLLHPYS